MKLSFSKFIWGIGKFFFWLSLLMVVVFIIELLIFPRLTTISEVRDFFSEGGWCYVGGDVIAEVRCEEKATTETPKLLIEKILNVPSQYIFMPIIIPLATLDTLQLLLSTSTPPGRQEINSFKEISFIVKLAPIWLIGMISVIYYFWKSSIKIVRKLRSN